MRDREFEQLEAEVPEELQNELDKMQRRERFYTFAVAGALSLAILFGVNWYRTQQADYVSYSYNNSAGYVNSQSSGLGGGGCCSTGGSSATAATTAQQGGVAGGGGCCSTGGGASSAPTDLATVEEQGLTYYKETYKDADVVAEAKDYGCHVQCDIVKDGEVIKSFSYRNGQLFEI